MRDILAPSWGEVVDKRMVTEFRIGDDVRFSFKAFKKTIIIEGKITGEKTVNSGPRKINCYKVLAKDGSTSLVNKNSESLILTSPKAFFERIGVTVI